MPRYRLALVTGASSGIGEHFARELAAAGSDLVLVARRADRLTALAGELASRHGVRADVIAADLADPASLAPVEQRLADTEDPVDLLVNNAGYGTTGPFAEQDLGSELNEIDVNVIALVRLTHAVLPGMISRGRGGVLNVASTAALTPAPNNATYCATKAYVTVFSEALHSEVRRHGVTVTALLPGLTRTDFQETASYNASWAPSFVWQQPQAVARAGLAAVVAGRAVCIPGAANKAMATVLRVTPRSLVRGITGRVSAP
jgi:short-subunit dehydrogenase